MRKIFSQPLFWTNVVTASVMLFLVGTIVFGWTNPLSSPPGGGGAISIISSGPDAGHVSVGNKRIQGIDVPTHPTDGATKGYVDNLIAQVSGGGKTLATLWGNCVNGTGPGCASGQGTPTCQAIFGSTGVSEAYSGFGPFVYSERLTTSPPSFDIVDNIPLCIDSATPYVDYGLGFSPNKPANYSAGWPVAGPYQYANTCRVCVLQ